ncbi:MAG: hypothetical protein IKN63_00210 [Bacilli bacterium]|nr:hypothetical protein [Bacilli bacterium]
MIESLIKKYNDDEKFLPEIIVSLEKMNVEELISIYLGYSSSVYFVKYPNISNVLNLMCDKIVERLDKLSILKVIEIYTDIYLRTLKNNERIGDNRDLIEQKKEFLDDDDSITEEAKRLGASREDVLNNILLKINNLQKDLEIFELSLKYIDILQTKIFNYLDIKLKSLSGIEREEVIGYLDKTIKENEEEIKRRDDILHSEEKLRLLLNYGQYGNSIYQVRSNIDPTELKIKNEDIYKSLQAIVLEPTIKK